MKRIEDFRVPRWSELPDIPLYLDQILILLDEWFGDYLSMDGKKFMTKNMVNNYVKLKYIPAPINKKYDKLSVASLTIIALLKPSFSIEEISNLIGLAIEYVPSNEAAYDMFCELIEQAVNCAFNGKAMPKTYSKNDPRHICWNACNAFACQLYVKSIYLSTLTDNKPLITE